MERDYAELIKALRFAFDQPCYSCVLGEKCNWGDFCFFKRAADAIEELLAKCVNFGDGECDSTQLCTCYGIVRAQINLLKSSVPKWISVEERLPEVAEKVLTYNGNFVSENWLCTVASKDGRINVWAYSEGFVTHWMPLPEPPQEGKP